MHSERLKELRAAARARLKKLREGDTSNPRLEFILWKPAMKGDAERANDKFKDGEN